MNHSCCEVRVVFIYKSINNMGHLSEQLKRYLATATPEQLEEDQKLMEEWKNIGPTVEEYLQSIGYERNKETNKRLN
jgi:hypothetical protein